MLTIAICDDEAYIAEKLKISVEQYLKEKKLDGQITVYLSGEALLSSGGNYDVFLLDMKLPGKNGIQVAECLRKEKRDGQIIFITSYQEYAFQAFYVDAVHYLLKPVSDAKLFHALDKALQWVLQRDSKSITITKGTETQVVFLRNIRYCEVMDHKVYIYTTTGSCDYFGTLETLQRQLDQRFYRCHRSFIVNLSYVVSKEHDSATVFGGSKVLVSRRKQQEFTRELLEFFQKEVL